MTPELIGIVAVGVALAGLILVSNRENARALRAEMKDMREDTRKQFESMRAEMKDMRGEMAKLRERMARIEGMFEGFLRRESRQAREPRRESEPAAA